ncbi:DEAD/DEAH box helicase [Candidatus Parcubacteria bacterium]|nr:MAG: DEAD/DEAH box helicase [Candidatus Parcubacteria bacterium]
MTDAVLKWDYNSPDFCFWLEDEQENRLTIDTWGLVSAKTPLGLGSVSHLLALISDGEAQVSKNKTEIIVSESQVANLDSVGLKRLGLPEPSPYRLEVRPQGLMSTSNFRFKYSLITSQGKPVIGAKRTGVFLYVGSRKYTLLDPLFSLMEGLDKFNSNPPKDIDERFIRWSELKALIPDGTIVHGHLKTMNIVRVDHFTLDISSEGDIVPVPLSKTIKNKGLDESEAIELSLPEAVRKSFAKYFIKYESAKDRYALDGSWYVVLSPTIRRVFSIIKEYQSRPFEERRAFFESPISILKDRLSDELSETEIESLFQETQTYLSKRIQYLGEWHPKVCAYILPPQQDWLPPEETHLAIPIDNKIIETSVKDLLKLKDAVTEAMGQGKAEIKFQGQTIPVKQETLDAIYRVIRPRKKNGGSDGEELGPKSASDLVPIILDNIEDLEFKADAQKRRGEPGGIPAFLCSTLFEHQRRGLEWLQEHWSSGSSGALLADDMGLGKTLQALAFLAWVKEIMDSGGYPKRPLLIVAPTGLLKNWQEEAERHLAAPGFGPPLRLFGAGLKALMNKTHLELTNTIKSSEWALTTYETLRDRIQMFLSVSWGIVVFDEVQKIKNPASRMTEMAKALDADFTLAMTGTPVENRLSDLWSILDASNPGLLGSLKAFHHRYEIPARDDPRVASDLAQFLTAGKTPPVMLRRLKTDHLKGLPAKEEYLLTEVMSSEQAEAYEAVIANARANQGAPGTMLTALHGLRSTSLLANGLDVSGLTDKDVENSARLRAMVGVLDDIANRNEKVLIFVDCLMLQEALIPYLQRRYSMSRPPLRISGKVSGNKRQQLVNEFQSGDKNKFDVMLLSPKAGGVGLTLTAANHVIHLTRWWNPAVEDQCSDRVYRIGQQRKVHIYYPMAIHPNYGEKSYDRKLHDLLAHKRKLSQSALIPPEFSQKDISDLFYDTALSQKTL